MKTPTIALPMTTAGGFDIVRVTRPHDYFAHFSRRDTLDRLCGRSGNLTASPFSIYSPKDGRKPQCPRCDAILDAAVPSDR